MKPLTKLLGVIAIIVTSGSVLATERSIFTFLTLPEPADWMLLSGLTIVASIARRRIVSVGKVVSGIAATDRGPLSTRVTGRTHSPTGPDRGH